MDKYIEFQSRLYNLAPEWNRIGTTSVDEDELWTALYEVDDLSRLLWEFKQKHMPEYYKYSDLVRRINEFRDLLQFRIQWLRSIGSRVIS